MLPYCLHLTVGIIDVLIIYVHNQIQRDYRRRVQLLLLNCMSNWLDSFVLLRWSFRGLDLLCFQNVSFVTQLYGGSCLASLWAFHSHRGCVMVVSVCLECL